MLPLGSSELWQACGMRRAATALGRPLSSLARRPQSHLQPETQEVLDGVLAGSRAALARAVTLVESSRADDCAEAEALLAALPAPSLRTLRLGVCGPPGVGKSSFVEALGARLLDGGLGVAVLAIDPSSRRLGGSILGDRTRMPELGRRTFVRPSPAKGHLGGVAAHTHAAVALCESAGHDVVIVESVGVGQSELAIDDVADVVVLLLPPAGGDDLQGVKAGIMEIADVVAVTKDDGSTAAAATRALGDVRRALRGASASRAKHGDAWRPVAVKCSAARAPETVGGVWAAALDCRAALGGGAVGGDGRLSVLDGPLLARRRGQRAASTWDLARRSLLDAFERDADVRALFDGALGADLDAARATPRDAARALVDAFLATRRVT